MSATTERALLSGNEAVAWAARNAGIALGTGYPGTPSTEILEEFGALGGKAQWAPNEKVGFEVALGAAFANARALVTMKHVGLNVASDGLFTAAYSGVSGALVVVSADDPGMASSQNEQDNRRYAVAAAVPMLEPSDSQEAYDMMHAAIEISEKWGIPVILRMTTRVCHSRTIVEMREGPKQAPEAKFVRDIKSRVMIPAHARPAHRRLREKLAAIKDWNETSSLNRVIQADSSLGIICSGIVYQHVREAAPNASVLKLGFTHPLPMDLIAKFASSVGRCLVIEENDPYLFEQIRSSGIEVEGTPAFFRFGELSVSRVKAIITGDTTPEVIPPRGKLPELCKGCSYRPVFEILRKLDCIVSGDIGCYTLGALPPLEAMDAMICMGAAIGMGLGMRHVLPPEEAKRVVSVIGDSTFVHSGITGLVEMVYNPPPTGHVVIILDNGTTAMTGQQEHPGTGRTLQHEPTGKIHYEALAESMGITNVHVMDVPRDPEGFEKTLKEALEKPELTLLIARRPCVLAAARIRDFEAKQKECQECGNVVEQG